MTVREIAKVVGRDGTNVQRWIKKIIHLQNADVETQNAHVINSIADHFSGYSPENKLRQESAINVYGYWFILRDISDELADILKLKKWFEEADQQTA